ncbi:DUF5984 family protein [Micromonospora sp. NPDC005173]|uniref:DUF5984 family protein n=1 Tax=Micromonospora sp. NPDC005173 TaxID=3157165 RepID=UPI0033A40ABB
MIRFRFELYPLDEVSSWGGDQPTLHWFGLTEGWYWLEVGGHQLLRRTRLDHPHPYVDYYLARLWEDVNVLTPDVLEPVPADLQLFIASDPAQWACDPLAFVTAGDEDGFGDIDPNAPDHPVVTAANWHGEHYLDLGYLRNAPSLRFWRTVRGDSDEITVDWRHEDNGEIGFTAGPAVRFCVPTAAYLEAVHTLDRGLMTAVLQRVEELERRGGLPGVDLDLVGLRREHEDRAHWLARNLDRTPKTDWDTVRQGADRLLGDPHQASAPTA